MNFFYSWSTSHLSNLCLSSHPQKFGGILSSKRVKLILYLLKYHIAIKHLATVPLTYTYKLTKYSPVSCTPI